MGGGWGWTRPRRGVVAGLDPEPALAALDQAQAKIAAAFPAFRNVAATERWGADRRQGKERERSITSPQYPNWRRVFSPEQPHM
jgi:hypothetical protein